MFTPFHFKMNARQAAMEAGLRLVSVKAAGGKGFCVPDERPESADASRRYAT